MTLTTNVKVKVVPKWLFDRCGIGITISLLDSFPLYAEINESNCFADRKTDIWALSRTTSESDKNLCNTCIVKCGAVRCDMVQYGTVQYSKA